MLILRIKSSNNHELSSSISALQLFIHAHYSTKSTQKHPITKHHFMVDYLVNSLGFSQDQALSTATKLETKFEVYRSFGWSDSEIITMARALPVCLRRSEAKLQTTLNFFMNELGYTAAYLATHPKMLVYSLEKRVMPRNSVLEILKEKKLLKYNFSLCSVVALSEVKFLDDFVLPYCDFVPHLYEAYPNATGYIEPPWPQPCISCIRYHVKVVHGSLVEKEIEDGMQRDWRLRL
ncbi:Mitochodrial transcription termination factor-related protein, partial [Cynara cardunculus var. scolymus]